MFTRCPDCRTVFHISAAELRAAEGTVICGACGVTFDALLSLSETRPAETHPPGEVPEAAPVPVEADAATAEEQARDEEEFLEELESLIGVEDAVPDTALEAAQTEVFDALEDEGEPLPEEPLLVSDEPDDEELDQPLLERPFEELADDEFADDEFADDELADLELADDELLDDDFPDPDSVFRLDDLPGAADRSEPGPFVGPGDDETAGPDGSAEETDGGGASERARNQEEAEARTGDLADASVLPRLEDEHRDEEAEGWDEDPEADASDARVPPPLGVDTDDAPPLLDRRGEQPSRRAWPKVLIVLLGLLLVGGTWAHAQRGALLRHPAGEALLGPVYRVLGVDARPEWSPADYRALRWEAVADPERPDRLVVAVEFVNAASFAQPYPIIRVVLEDRFGRRVGRYDFGPEQYLEAHTRGSRLSAGGRVRTSVEAPDPDGRADGFRVDFCLETPGGDLACGPELFR